MSTRQTAILIAAIISLITACGLILVSAARILDYLVLGI